jgi:hypothetical protein
MRASLSFLLLLVAGCGGSGNSGTGGNGASSFASEVKPILTNGGCLGHHMTTAWDGVNTLTSNADIVNYLTATKATECGGTVSLVAPGDSANSYLYQKLSGGFAASCGAHTGAQMPLGGAPLAAAQMAMLKAWIDDGAVNN